MERVPFDKQSTSGNVNRPEEVRGILQRLLRMVTGVMAKKLFERSQAGVDQSQRHRRLPRK